MRRSASLWAGLGLLLLLVGTLLGLWECFQRRRFERLSEDRAAIAAEIQETAKLGRNADGSVGLTGKPEGRYGSSHGSSTGYGDLLVTRMDHWGCFGLAQDPKLSSDVFDQASFDLQLYQERHLILFSPEVRIVSKMKLHHTIRSAVETRLIGRGIRYTVRVGAQ